MIQKQASDNRPLHVSKDDARRLRDGTLTQMRALESFKQMPHDQLDEVFFWGFEDMDQAVFTYDGNTLLYSPKYPIGRIIHILTDQDSRVGSIQIIDIKVERIRNISHVDALAMGVTPMPHRDRKSGSSDSHIDAVLYNWNQWYAHEKFNTHRNPWCWVYHFKFSPPVKEELQESPWVSTTDRTPNDNESTPYLCMRRCEGKSKPFYQRQILVFNPDHMVWDNEDGDDFNCELKSGPLYGPDQKGGPQ